ncbi:MAG: DNA polymerase III subunit beta [Candidatus Saccharibacteria bacterium]|nr:DNA polymerase III subunit beta [Candidatus Saccharibacteria bacterium]
MKLSVMQENLSRALSTVSRVASTRGSLPILSNVLLKTEGNRLLLAATNLDIAISESVGVKITKEGSITVPARLMQDFVSSLPAGKLDLELKDNKLKISAERFDSTINGVSAEEFPVMPTIEGGSEMEFSSAEIKQTLQQVLFSASSDEARPVLTGIYIFSSEEGDKLYIAATDSYRLAEKNISKKIKDVSLLIPAHSLQELLRTLKEDSDIVSLTFDDQQARFKVSGTEIVTRLVEGNYPDYKKLLPKSYETTAKLSRHSLAEITKVSSLFAREAAGSITLVIDEEKKQISISSIASQVGENTATAEAEVSGSATITMNSRYILDAMQAFEGSTIQININGKLDPCVLTDPDDDSYLHVIMPVKS